MFLGVAPAGANDIRVVNLGESLARSGLVTMFYWSRPMVERRIHYGDVDNLVVAFQHLQSQPYVDPDRVGMGGFCVGASFVLMAAAREEVRDDVTFVNAFGPYYEMTNYVRAIASDTRVLDGEVQYWEVDKLPRAVFEADLISALDRMERRIVAAALYEGDFVELERASPEAIATYRLMAGVSLEEANALIDELSPELRANMERVSPSSYIDGLRATILVMHDREDNLVPSAESRRLVAELESNDQVDVRYTEFSFFQHVDPTRPVGPVTFVQEAAKLAAHMYSVLRNATS